jgi:cytochrome P450
MTVTPTAAGYGDVFGRVLDPAHRPKPYPLYARLRKRPVAVQDDGAYVVSTCATITRLLHRGSDQHLRGSAPTSARAPAALVRWRRSGAPRPARRTGNPPFISSTRPEHDRLRRLVMQQFTPARIRGMHRRMASWSTRCSTPAPTGASSTSWTTWPIRCRSP